MLQSSSRGVGVEVEGVFPAGGVCLDPGGICLVPGGLSLPGKWCLPGPGGVLPAGGYLPGPGDICLETPPVDRITDTCKNITLATTSLRPVMTLMSKGHSHYLSKASTEQLC